MERTERDELMEQMAKRMQRKAIRNDLPVEKVEYDTDETGKIEWVHIKYADGFVGHVDISGLGIEKAFDLVWEIMRKRM